MTSSLVIKKVGTTVIVITDGRIFARSFAHEVIAQFVVDELAIYRESVWLPDPKMWTEIVRES